MWERTAIMTSKHRFAPGIWAALVLAAIATGCLIWWLVSKQTSPFPATIQQSSQLTLFYPTTLPQGYELDRSSIQHTNGVVTYVAKNSVNKYINFSLQPRADNFDFTAFYTTTLVKAFKFTTTYGEATVGNMQSNGNMVGSLINGDTWLLISAPPVITSSSLQTIISNLSLAQAD